MPELAVSAIGRDRPGIVAAISGALLELGGNIEDSRMSILRGHFAVMLLVRVPADVDRAAVERRLGAVRDELSLEALVVNDVAELDARSALATHVVSVYGADRPGIVHTVSSALSELGVNVTDLQTRLAGPDPAPIYVMTLEVSLGEAGADEVASALGTAGAEAGVEVAIRELGAETL